MNGCREAVGSCTDPNVDGRLRATLDEVDHRRVAAPYVRLVERTAGVGGGAAYQWDLRLTQPNVDHIDTAAVHSLEHMLGTYLPRHAPGVVNLGPMGCQTGFYLTTLDYGDYDGVLRAFEHALHDCLAASAVPLANDRQCGFAANHTLEGAQRIAGRVLAAKDGWDQVFVRP